MLNRWTDIIAAWPSPADFAADLGVRGVTVRAWRVRGIPAARWSTVVAIATRRGIPGISFPLLAALANPAGAAAPQAHAARRNTWGKRGHKLSAKGA